MADDICYLCDKPISNGQSFYEDHGQKVCIACFRVAKRCQRCKFPSNDLKRIEGFGQVCDFCYEALSKEEGMTCYLCNGKIWSNASHYADHGKTICQPCFKDVKDRCFTCRFPKIEKSVEGQGKVCEFCIESNLNKEIDLKPLLKPLQAFLLRFDHDVSINPNLLWVDWKLVLGMQQESENRIELSFFDEFVRYAYPIYYLKGTHYIIPSIPREWFMPYMASQLVAAEICKKYDLFHLRGDSPFLETARGWCHWVAYSTAKTLKYDKVARHLTRWPESALPGNFSKFLAMSEFRKHGEVIKFAQTSLKNLAEKHR